MCPPEVNRQAAREKEVDDFLDKYSLTRRMISPPALKCLDDWARYQILVRREPSANSSAVLLELCKAVESEVANRLRGIAGLGLIEAGCAMGDMVRCLRNLELTPQVKTELQSRNLKPGFVQKSLPDQLKLLADLRNATHAAHGKLWVGSATVAQAAEAQRLTGTILKSIVARCPGDK